MTRPLARPPAIAKEASPARGSDTTTLPNTPSTTCSDGIALPMGVRVTASDPSMRESKVRPLGSGTRAVPAESSVTNPLARAERASAPADTTAARRSSPPDLSTPVERKGPRASTAPPTRMATDIACPVLSSVLPWSRDVRDPCAAPPIPSPSSASASVSSPPAMALALRTIPPRCRFRVGDLTTAGTASAAATGSITTVAVPPATSDGGGPIAATAATTEWSFFSRGTRAAFSSAFTPPPAPATVARSVTASAWSEAARGSAGDVDTRASTELESTRVNSNAVRSCRPRAA